jgi:hypothetical protein
MNTKHRDAPLLIALFALSMILLVTSFGPRLLSALP